MTPEQIRAKQKLITANRQMISAIDAIKQYAPILFAGEASVISALEYFEPSRLQAYELIEALERLPDGVEIFTIDAKGEIQSPQFDWPPEGPGIDDYPRIPVSTAEE